MRKLAKRLADRISRSIQLGELSTGWGQFKYFVAAWLYAWSDTSGGSDD